MLSLIKNIFLDILKIYKNFFHWNISKIIITIFSYIIGFLISLPFLILAIITALFIDVNWSEIIIGFFTGKAINPISYIGLFDNYLLLFPLLLFLIISFFAIVIGRSYSNILMFKLNLGYLKGEKIGYFKNLYLDKNYIVKYVQILFWILLFWLIPLFIFLFSFVVGIIINGGVEPLNIYMKENNSFSIILFIIFVLCVITFIYISYRLIFSYIILVDKGADKRAFHYIKKSVKLTKGIKNLFIFFSLAVLITILLLPFNILQDNVKKEMNILNYSINNRSIEESKTDIYLKYGDASLEDLINLKYKINFIRYFLWFISFLIIFGITEMFLVSYYYRHMKHHDEEYEENNSEKHKKDKHNKEKDL